MNYRVHPYMQGCKVAAKHGDTLIVSQDLLDALNRGEKLEVSVIDLTDWWCCPADTLMPFSLSASMLHGDTNYSSAKLDEAAFRGSIPS